MNTDESIIPFRWDLSQRSQLGHLTEGELAEVPDGYYDHLGEVSAKVVARSDNSQLVFVGRSPEHIFDYLSGAFADLKAPPTLTLLQFSGSYAGSYWSSATNDHGFSPRERAAFLGYLRSQSIDPANLAKSPAPLRFVDMVYTGRSYRLLLDLFKLIAKEQGADWNVVSRRLGFIGITAREKNSPNTFRWQQANGWREASGPVTVKNISVPWPFWDHTANVASKVTPSFHRRRWFNADAAKPSHNEENLKAMRRSVDIFNFAANRTQRLKLARTLAGMQEFKHAWLRDLARELKA